MILMKIYESRLNENLIILTDFTTNFFDYENVEFAKFLNSEYVTGKNIALQYINEVNDYYLYTGKFVSDKNLDDLEEKIVCFMRSDYIYEPMNAKSPRYDTEDIYDLELSENEERFEVLASGKILSINVNDETDINRLYSGEI